MKGVPVGVRALVIVLIGAMSSGCAAGGYSTSSVQQRLVQAGLRPAQAKCVTDKMVARFGKAQLNARTEAIAAELKAEHTLLLACGLTADELR